MEPTTTLGPLSEPLPPTWAPRPTPGPMQRAELTSSRPQARQGLTRNVSQGKFRDPAPSKEQGTHHSPTAPALLLRTPDTIAASLLPQQYLSQNRGKGWPRWLSSSPPSSHEVVGLGQARERTPGLLCRVDFGQMLRNLGEPSTYTKELPKGPGLHPLPAYWLTHNMAWL